MIWGAFKRTTAVELAAYLVYAVGAVLVALLLPWIAPIPEWVTFVLMIGVQVLLYRRFYGRF